MACRTEGRNPELIRPRRILNRFPLTSQDFVHLTMEMVLPFGLHVPHSNGLVAHFLVVFGTIVGGGMGSW